VLNRGIGALTLAGIVLGLAAAALADGTPYFVKKDTWVETAVASREALAAQEEQAARDAAAAKDADPALKAFEAAAFQMTGPDEPRAVKVRVAGLKKIYIGADGARSLFLGDLRLVDASGNARPAELDKAKTTPVGKGGNLWHDKQRDWKPSKWGDRVFEKGCRLERIEFELPLDGTVESVEMTVGAADKNDKRPADVWVDWRSRAKVREQHTRALEMIAMLTYEAFPDPISFRERRIEELAGIWKDALVPGDWADLADRYARAAGKMGPAAKDLAKNCKAAADLKAVRDLFYVQHAATRLALAADTLAFVEKAAPRPDMAARLKDLQGRLAEAQEGKAAGEALYAKACGLRREIILSHPLLDFPKLLINKRTGNLPEHMCDQYLGQHSQAAPGLVVLDDWKTQPKETVLLEGKLPKGATLQPSLAYDAKRVLFAFADHASPRAGQLRGYYIYEYSFETGQVRQVTGTDRDAETGRGGRETVLVEDTAPCYLPDGGLAFISTRSQQFGRCHGGRYVPAYTLYRAEADGSNIRALSFNESNEWAPSVLPDGAIIYCRWDYVNRHDTIFQSLWIMHPDGTQTGHYYGNNSREPCMISEPHAIPGSLKAVCTAAAHHGQTLGTIIVVDPSKGQDYGEPLTWITPELLFPESGVPDKITRAKSPLPEDAAPGGRAATPWPLSEDLFLCTYQHGMQFAVTLVDTLGGREVIAWDPKTSCFDPIPLRPRPMPPVLPSAIAAKPAEKTGTFFVQDVYESSQPIPRGTIKAMRINQLISEPTRQVPSRSLVEDELVKKVLGTVPVNEDGSVAFEAPAETPMQFQLLDANGMAVMTMRSLVYVQPGEKAACAGCHEPRTSAPTPSARRPATFVKITPPVGPQYAGGFSFVRSVQPVLDRYCIGCHGPDKAEGGVDLVGAFTKRGPDGKAIERKRGDLSIAYESLLAAPGMVKIAQRFQETTYSKPKDYFAAAGKLAKMLLAGHPAKDGAKRVDLDRESFQRIADWLDLNAQFYGDYSYNRFEMLAPPADAEKALREAVAQRFGPDLAKQPLAALVNVANPAESRVLLAPMPVAAGGWGQWAAGAWRGADDPAYLDMRKLVDAAVPHPKYQDVAGTCGRPDGCACGNCWVRKDADARRQRLAAGKDEQPVASR